MENASKALLIAAAILIAIILISLGLIVINQGRTAVDEAGTEISDVAMQAFNAKFTPYIGKNISGSQVRSLIDAVNANNSVNAADTSKVIYVQYPSPDGVVVTSSPARSHIQTNVTYEVRAVIIGHEPNPDPYKGSVKTGRTS